MPLLGFHLRSAVFQAARSPRPMSSNDEGQADYGGPDGADDEPEASDRESWMLKRSLDIT